MAKKRPSLASVDELFPGLGNKNSPTRPALGEWERGLLGANTDGGLRDQKTPEGGYQVDPDPTANTMPFQLQATSTTNPKRPRTLSAGYDAKKQTLTVVFRDGTYWNYYDVPVNIWDGFRKAESKGKFLRSSGLDTWDSMGPADLSTLTDTDRALLSASISMATRMQQASSGQQQNIQGPQF